MIADLKPYQVMKDSGVPCLGVVPMHWEVRKLRDVLKQVANRNRSDLPLLSVVRDKGVILRDTTSKDENHNFIPEDLSKYKVVRSGQFAMNKMKAWQGSYGVSSYDGIVSPAYFVFDVVGVEGDYFHAAIRSRAYVPCFTQASDGVRIGQWDLSQDRMKEIAVAVPPADEQAAIVRFIDHADRRIRRAIAAKQKLIKLLEEQRQAIVHRAVTRGLDPDVRLKSSGVEWLGDVPAHWEVARLGRLIELITGFPFKSDVFTQDADDIRLLRGINISPGRVRWDDVARWSSSEREEFEAYELRPGDIVLGMDRPIIKNGVRVAMIEGSDVPSLLLQRVARIRPRRELIPEFLLMLLAGRSFSNYLRPIFTGISVPHLSPEQLKSFLFALPSIDEQKKLLEQVATEGSDVDAVVARALREIALLREYRTRLIADVVTGKLDVREAAAQLPDQIDPAEAAFTDVTSADGDEDGAELLADADSEDVAA